ncbi:MAG: GntR family transcriptional regulator [Verrucomicrobia bacterium]|nr:GntR family transcriptional regulator [Verrucomicrobiota bacterium]
MTPDLSENQQGFPKYFQIAREISDRIQKGELRPGSVVPSENEIIDRHGVSNTTARKALHELEKAGWVRRIRGKGTFVSKNTTVERSVSRIFGFTKNMLEAGRKPATKLIGFHLRYQDHSQVVNGKDYTLRAPFCEIERIRFADGIPMMKETRFISLQLFPDIHRKNLEKSLYDIFEKDYGIRLTEIRQILSAVVMEGDLLKLFELGSPVPAFRVEGVSFCGKEMIAEMENSIYRGDMYRFAVTAV